MAEALEKAGVKVVGYEESKNPKFMDGEVSLENSFNIQVGSNYACLCIIQKGGEIDYLLEIEEIEREADFAKEVASYIMQPRESPRQADE